jgi:4-carboxymuconolactone decarboxylase
MSRYKENMNKLTRREKELTAIGAAIASNCVPCIEYHIPQGRKAGLSDSQIREAIEWADKVRRVPADKVLQTAYALLESKNTAEMDTEDVPCGCPDTEAVSEESAGCGERRQNVERVHLENPSSEEDNDMKSKSCDDRLGGSEKACGSEKAEAAQQDSADKPGFDCSKMMQMMGECCPEKMKHFSSMMDAFMGGCCSSEEERGPKASGAAKPAA